MNQENVSLPLAQLKSNRWNRKTFDATGLQELSDSIKSKGILEPLIVRKLDDGKYEIASGERRWKAALMAGKTEAPCLVQPLSDEDVQDMNLVANIQREDLPALEKAAMVKERMASGNLTQLQMAKMLGKSDAWIGELLAFLSLPEQVHQSLSQLPMNIGQMRAITSLPNAEYQKQIAQELQDGKIKPEHVEQRAHQLHNGFKASMAKREKKASTVSSSTSPNATIGEPSLGSLPAPAGNDGKNGATTTQPKNPSPSPFAKGGSRGDLPSAVPSIEHALKTDVLDHLLPGGNLGVALRSIAQNQKGKSWWKWVLASVVISALYHPVLNFILKPFRVVQQTAANTAASVSRSVGASETAAMPTVTPQDGEQKKFTTAMFSKVAAPTGFTPEIMAGKKIHFTWNPVPGCIGYNFYSAFTWENSYKLENTKPLTKTEAWWKPDSGPADFKFVITALDSQGHESEYSESVDVDLR